MGVTANWHLGDLQEVAEGPDPLGPAQARIEEIGMPIDLEDGQAKLNAVLVGLIQREAVLFSHGVTCDIKDNQQTCCSACPIRNRDELDPLSALCTVGVAQEQVITLAVIAREQPHRLPT